MPSAPLDTRYQIETPEGIDLPLRPAGLMPRALAFAFDLGLRGVVMGEAGQASGVDGVSELLYEFFSNSVVRRDQQPRVPGDLIPMTLPSSMAASVPGSDPDERPDV